MRQLIDCCFSGLGKVTTAIFEYVIGVLVIQLQTKFRYSSSI
jgi:hypothetical protein